MLTVNLLTGRLIGYVDREAPNYGALILRGPNEHSLACGALSNWQLYQKPFLIQALIYISLNIKKHV